MSRFSEADLAEFVARGARAAATAGAAAAAAGAPAPARRRPRHIEDGLQRAVCQFWELGYPETWRKTWHTPNGLAAKNPKLAGIFKGLGVKPGVFDLVCIARRGPYSGFALELKQPRGRASEHQCEWTKLFYGERWCVAIAFSLDSALDHIRKYHELPAAI